MKKSLFLVASLVMSSSAFAQWTRPVPKFVSEFKTSAPAAVEGDTTIYYLYNTEAEGFLAAGNAPAHSQWASNAIISDNGAKIMIRKYELSETPDETTATNVGTSEAAVWDEKTYVITDLYTNGKWLDVIITSAMGSFMDRAKQIDYKWEIIPQGNGTYRIKTADINPNFSNAGLGIAESFFGWDELDDDWVSKQIKSVTPAIDMSNTDAIAHVDWKFVDEAGYAEYLVSLNTYNKAQELSEKIAQAKELGLSTADAEKVYNNSSSTLDELTAALDAVLTDIKNKEFGSATEDNPMDVTEWIENPSFDGNVNGWTNTFVSGTNATNVGFQGRSGGYVNGEVSVNQFIEAWANASFSDAIESRALGVGELSQTIKNMPAGKYKFTVDCISNNQDGHNPAMGVQLFAKGGDIDIYTTLATGNGLPEHFEVVFVNDGADITMGLRTTEECTANWIAADNFTLTYYGPTSENPYKIVLDAALKEILAVYPMEDMEDLKANKNDKEAFIKAIEEAQAATDNYTECKLAVEAAKSALDKSAKAYAKFAAKAEEWINSVNSKDIAGEKWESFCDFAQDMDTPEGYPEATPTTVLEDLELTAEEIEEYIKTVDALSSEAIASALKPGDDCTDMLINPDFSAGDATGWTVNINPTNFAWTGGLIPNAAVCESWHSKFDISQVVNNVPDGIYSISLNGFCRLDDGVDKTVPAEVYLNEYSSTLMNLYSTEKGAALPMEEAQDGFNCYLSNGDGGAWTNNPKFEGATRKSPADNIDSQIEGAYYVPNGMEGASVAFSAGRYEAKAYGYVQGGKMTIGVRNTKSVNVWALWGNFKLTYEGETEEAIAAMMAPYTNAIDEYMTNFADDLTEPAKEIGQKALDDAAKATSIDIIPELNDALIALRANIDAVSAFNTAKNELEDAKADASASSIEKYYDTLADKLGDISALSTEDINALTADITNAVEYLKIPNTEGAADDNPIDMTSVIKNADFQANSAKQQATDWTLVKGETAQGNYQVQNGYNGGVSMEFWSNTNGSGTQFDFFQRIAKLPAGTYELKANASNSLNGQEAGPGEGAAYIYAGAATGDDVRVVTGDPIAVQTEGCTELFNSYSVIINLKEGEDLVVGAKNIGELSARWVMIDDFTLSYYGTNSSKTESETTAIETAESANAAIVAIYNISGTQVNSIQKGINIVKMSDGSVKKVLVK